MHPWMYVPTFCFVQANWWLGQTHVHLKKKNYLLQLVSKSLTQWRVCYSNCVLLTFICLFIVMTKRTIKYMTKIGQKTGMLKNSKNVHVIAMTIALVAPYLGRENTSNKKDWSVLLMWLIITIKKFSNLIGSQLSWCKH